MSGTCPDCGGIECYCVGALSLLRHGHQIEIDVITAERDRLRAELDRAKAEIAWLRERCQCRRPESGRDGYTCPRCDDAAALSVVQAEIEARKGTHMEGEPMPRERFLSEHGVQNEAWIADLDALIAAEVTKAVAPLRAALEEIAEHPHQDSQHDRPFASAEAMSYGSGVVDGHRCAAEIARRALGRSVP
jgi:hypothetical protein